MVIITTLVAKIYFPSWLEPREENPPPLSHSYMAAMENTYKSDLSDDEVDQEEAEGLLENGEGGKEEGTSDNKNGMFRSGASSFLSEYDSRLQTKESVYGNLAICAIMLNVTFVVWGLLQVSCFVHLKQSCSISSYLLTFHHRLIKGTDVNTPIPPPQWRILHILLRTCLHQPFLDTSHVRHTTFVLQTTYISNNHHL